MRREKMTKDRGDFVPEFKYQGLVRCCDVSGAYLKSSLSSENPDARASTADGVPMLRRAKIARYRSNSGKRVSSNEVFKASVLDSKSSGFS